MYLTVSAMHRVGSASNGNSSTRPRKEKRLTYVLNDSDDSKVSSLFYLFYLFQGSIQVSCLLASSSCIFIPIHSYTKILSYYAS